MTTINTSATMNTFRVRIDKKTMQRASDVLAERNMLLDDAIRLLIQLTAYEGRLPFEIKVPNKETREAMAELEAGKGKSFDTVEELMADLNADD